MVSFETFKLMAQTANEFHKQPARLPKKVQTMARAYDDICAGEDPWTGLGNFTNAWYSYARHIRSELVSEPLARTEQETAYTHRWAAFCAASTEFLCERYNVPCPNWVHDPYYILKEPWWKIGLVDSPAIRADLQKTAPPPFARRNIFCTNRLFQNKYEMREWICEAIDLGLTDIQKIHKYARQKEISIHGG